MTTCLAMLTLPNSGSTWLAEVIAQHTAWSRYRMEFFNPIRTPAHYARLRRQFGCELIECYRNIVEPGDASIDDDIRETWGREGLNFTKEVFSPFKLAAFCRHFRCFVLLRSAADSFPPRRLRIWSFYEHAWYALRDRGELLAGETYEQRALSAHDRLTRALLADAQAHGVPVLNYRDLFDDEQLADKIEAAIGECDGRLLCAIRESRRLVGR